MPKPEITIESDYTKIADKPDSASTGYIATLNGKTYVLKESVLQEAKGIIERGSKRDFVAEVVTGDLYNIILGDQSPKIGVVKGSEDGKILLSSEFIEGFESLSSLTSGPDETSIDPSSSRLKEIEGFEAVIAACLFCGDPDYHAGNIGINKDNKIVKIDHGRAATEAFSSSEESLETLKSRMDIVGYAGGCDLNLDKFSKEIRRLSDLTDSEISESIKEQISSLKKLGFSVADVIPFGGKQTFAQMAGFDYPKKKVRTRRTRGEKSTEAPKTTEISPEEMIKIEEASTKALVTHYIDGFKKRQNVMRDMSQTLAIVEKIDPPTKEWTQGKWLDDITEQNPLIFAVKENRKIDGKDPIIWIKDNRSSLESDGIYPFVNSEGKVVDVIDYCRDNKISVGDKGIKIGTESSKLLVDRIRKSSASASSRYLAEKTSKPSKTPTSAEGKSQISII